MPLDGIDRDGGRRIESGGTASWRTRLVHVGALPHHSVAPQLLCQPVRCIVHLAVVVELDGLHSGEKEAKKIDRNVVALHHYWQQRYAILVG